MTDATETPEAEEPQSISDLFNDDAETPDQGAEAEKGETVTEDESGQQTDDSDAQADTGDAEADGTEAGEDKSEDTTSEPPSEEGESVPRRALIDERKKRQEAQEELERLKQQHGVDREELPDPTEDPEGYEKALRQKWEKEQWERTANRSREKAMEQHADYEEKERHFMVLAQNDPDLIKQMNESHDPAGFAYDKARESLDAQEKSIEERVIERLRKEGKLKEDSSMEDKSAETASKVSDLTKASAAGKNSEQQVTESENPEDVFGDDLKY